MDSIFVNMSFKRMRQKFIVNGIVKISLISVLYFSSGLIIALDGEARSLWGGTMGGGVVSGDWS